MLSIIAAIGKNNELGKDNTLLWKIPADMKHFREITGGHTVIMGRKTFESIGRPLPKRRNIVITRDKAYLKEGVEIVYSLEKAIQIASNGEESFIIGGAEIYKQSLPLVDRLYITHIDAEDKTADSFFPAIGPEWQEKNRQTFPADSENPHSYYFVTYERVTYSTEV